MTRQQFRLLAALAVVAAGLGVGLSNQGASADPPAPAAIAPRPALDAPPKRQEATTRFPQGTFVKEFDAQPYASGSLSFTYAGDAVSSVIEVSAPQFAGEVEFATESELSMSKNGVIYGIINSVRVTKLKLNPELLDGLPVGAGAYPLVEPLVNEVMVDLPFSYRCRIDGDRITISNYRILLAGPNPLGKYGAIELLGPAGYAMAIGTAIEGTYTRADAEAKPRRRAK